MCVMSFGRILLRSLTTLMPRILKAEEIQPMIIDDGRQTGQSPFKSSTTTYDIKCVTRRYFASPE